MNYYKIIQNCIVKKLLIFFRLLTFFIIFLFGGFFVTNDLYAQDEFDNIDLFADDVNNDQALDDNTQVRVDSLVVLINDRAYTNGVVGRENKDETVTQRLAVVMRYMSIHKGDVLSAKVLKRKINASAARLVNSRFFPEEAINVNFEVHSNVNDEIVPITVYVFVKNIFEYAFGGGSIYGYFSLNKLTGFSADFYGGVNRQEIILGVAGIAPYRDGTDFKNFMFDFDLRLLNYWLWALIEPTYFDSLIYGGNVSADAVFHPTFKFSQSAGAFGHTTVKRRGKSDDFIEFTGSPLLDNTGLSLLFGSMFTYENDFKDAGFFANFIKIRLPYFYGLSNDSVGKSFTWFDLSGYEIDAQASFQTGLIHQAFHLKSNFIAALSPSSFRPYITKANLKSGFAYDTALEFDMFLRGNYPQEITIGNYGYTINLEYRLGFLRAGIVGFETFLFYDVGAAANEIGSLLDNTRHTFGPGIGLHFFDPVGLIANFSLGIGGPLIGNPDGNNLSFNFFVRTRK